jgi:DNA-binding MarR family transcriptional regulator
MMVKSTRRKTSDPDVEEAVLADLYDMPGHLIRRAQQISVSMFYDVMGTEVTPIQYAILRTLHAEPGIDQVALAGRVAVDTSTAASTAARLESKGLLTREVRPANRRQRILRLTAAGTALIEEMVPSVHQLRDRMLATLTPAERDQFFDLLRKFVHINNAQSRAPLRRDEE